MFRHRIFLTIIRLGVVILATLFCASFAKGEHSITLSYRVVADPGQTEVPVYFILTSSSSVGGIDMFLEFDRDLLACSSIKWLTRFQSVSYDINPSGKIKIVARRHHPDSTYLGPITPGTDTLGMIRMNVTPQDLLADVETRIRYFENPLTPFYDNRLQKSDSSYIIPPELRLNEGSVFIRHPLYGDVNDDGFSNTIADVIFLINYLAGSRNLSPRQRANSDVNRDGVQGSMTDFVELIRVVSEE